MYIHTYILMLYIKVTLYSVHSYLFEAFLMKLILRNKFLKCGFSNSFMLEKKVYTKKGTMSH